MEITRFRSRCSVADGLRLGPGTRREYEELSRFHYRRGGLGPYKNIYAIYGDRSLCGARCVGVIVYGMPSPSLAMRKQATGGVFAGHSRRDALRLLNVHMRTIRRVILDPRFRGMGLATWLVSKTLPLAGTTYVEAVSAMGRYCRFFAAAGMQQFEGTVPPRCIELRHTLEQAGIHESLLIHPAAVQRRIERMNAENRTLVDCAMRKFLKSYKSRRNMAEGPERTRFVLSHLPLRSDYYLWKNPQRSLQTNRTLA